MAKDPDEDILSYILVGDQNLTFPFELSKSGELVTTEVLDFERQEKYSLTVRALDANGSFQERVFDVDIIDCFIPVVNTLLPYFDENGTLQVGGEISDDGGNSQNLEVGILVSESPIGGLLGNEGVMELEIFESQNLYRFEKGMIPKKGWEKIYVRAYAKNAEGVAYGFGGIHSQRSTRRPKSLGRCPAGQWSVWMVGKSLVWNFLQIQERLDVACGTRVDLSESW